jgi:hypothetical protein
MASAAPGGPYTPTPYPTNYSPMTPDRNELIIDFVFHGKEKNAR